MIMRKLKITLIILLTICLSNKSFSQNLPDFTVEIYSVTPSNPAEGTAPTIRINTNNIGTSDYSSAGVVSFYLSKKTYYDATATYIGNQYCYTTLAGGDSYVYDVTSVTIPSGTSLEQWYLLAYIDGYYGAEESDESNNVDYISITVTENTSLPDLILSFYGASPSTINAGGSTSLTFNLTNSGEASAGSNTTEIYLSSNTTCENYMDEYLGSYNFGSINVGENNTTGMTVTIPPETEVGTWYIVARVDANDEVNESNEDNNRTSYYQVNIIADRDLNPDITSINPTEVTAGENLSINFSLSNLGDDDVGTSEMSFYVSTNSTFESANDIYLGSYNCSSILGNNNISGAETLTIPGTLTSGTYYILCIADSNNDIAETNESNNVASQQITVLPKPDLFIVSVTANPGYVFEGETTSVSFTTVGAYNTSGPSTTKLYLSSDNSFDDQTDIFLTHHDFGTINPNDALEITKDITIPVGTPSGLNYILCITDANSEVDESYEDNNVYYEEIYVNEPAPPEFTIIKGCEKGKITVSSTHSGLKTFVLSYGNYCGQAVNSETIDAKTYTFTDLPDGTYTASIQMNGSTSGCSEEIELVNYEKPVVSVTVNDNSLTVSSGLTTYQTFYLSDDNCNTFIDSYSENTNTHTFSDLGNGTYTCYLLEQDHYCYSECSEEYVIVNKPDLYVTNVSANPEYIVGGESCTLTFELGNGSNLGPAGASTTKIYLSSDNQVDTEEDILLDTEICSGVQPREEIPYTKELDIPENLDQGTWYLIIEADVNNDLEEGQETNNTNYKSIFIIEKPVEPIISTPNYIKTEVPLIPGAADDMPYELSLTNISYIDGLGKTIQNIGVRQSPAGNDIVQGIEYDELGRQHKTYLPYSIEGTGDYVYDPGTNNLFSFYHDEPNVSLNTYPYSQNVYDGSPLNRVVEQYSPGDIGVTQFSDYSASFNWDEFVLNPDGGGGSVSINIANNEITVNFNAGFSLSPLKTGQIVELNTSQELPNLMLGTLSEGGYQVYIEDNHLAIKGDYSLVTGFIDVFSIPLNRSEPVQFEYLLNTLNEVICWKVNSDNSLEKDANVYYGENTLFKTRTIDENNNSVYEYTDLEGKTVLKKANDGTKDLLTYYVYDSHNLLRYVIPPLAVENLGTETVFDITHDVIKNLCYYYEYGHRNRMVTKKLPGADPVYMVYDDRDRLVLSQDGNQRLNNEWNFTKYDVLNRPVITGIYTHSEWVTQDEMQTYVNGQMVNFYEEIPAGVDYLDANFGYTNQSFPASSFEIFTVAYYDNYEFDQYQVRTYSNIRSYSETFDDSDYSVSDINNNVTGLVTGTLTNILGTSDYLISVHMYDNKNRILRTYTENYLGGDDLILNKYDFIGNVIKSKQVHLKEPDTDAITITQQFIYDHAQRLEKVYHQMGDDVSDNILMAEMEYNEIGQLIKKKLHKTVSDDFLQEIDFEYNSRGWLAKINDLENTSDDLFAMQLVYNEEITDISGSTDVMYNGNISALLWQVINNKQNVTLENEEVSTEVISNYEITLLPGTTLLPGAHLIIDPSASVKGDETGITSDKQAYTFSYDEANRLTKGDYRLDNSGWANTDNYDLELVSYDANGNITFLKRNDEEGLYLDDLVYDYLSDGNYTNQLRNVTDNGDMDNGFYDQTNGGVDEEYLYDNNGNLIVDDNKSFDVYYNYLNLPEEIDFGNGDKIKYIYDASGVKLAKETYHDNSLSMEVIYNGNIIYEGPTGSDFTLLTSEGKISVTSSENTYEYYLKDHLGNTRVMFHDDGSGNVMVDQVNSYYPFGMLFEKQNLDKNKFLYNGKELQEDVFNDVALDWYDYGARMYDAALARFHTNDPLAEKFSFQSPYVYAANNPILFIDKHGKNPVPTNTGYGLMQSFAGEVSKVHKQNPSWGAGKTVAVAFKNQMLKAATYSDVGDATVLATMATRGGDAINVDGSKADGFDKAGAVIGAFAPFVGGKIISKGLRKGADALGLTKKADDGIKVVVDNADKVDRNLLDAPTTPGNAPTFKSDGTSVEIHHVGQDAKGPFKEMHKSDHRLGENYKKNHPAGQKPLTKEERKQFNKARSEYWKNEYKNE